MDTKTYINNLFSEYENTEALEDFKEELESNLKDRIRYLESRGTSPGEARDKASAELGDISDIADEMSFRKKKEIFEEMYMKTRKYISTKRMVAYVLLGGIMAFGLIIAALAYLYSEMAVAGLGSLIPFFIVPACGLLFMGLTQETARNNPMSWKRALIYTLAAALVLFGLNVFSMMFFISGTGLPEAIATLIPFVLPGSMLLIFLILTEKNRNKPWVIEEQQASIAKYQRNYADSPRSEKMGLLSGALWLFILALFVTLGFIIGFRYSWMVFLFAVPLELLIVFAFNSRS